MLKSGLKFNEMIDWTPIAVNEKSMMRGRIILPEYSAAVIGNSVVLRMYGGGLAGVAYGLTTIAFATSAEASAWIEANKSDEQYDLQIATDPRQSLQKP